MDLCDSRHDGALYEVALGEEQQRAPRQAR